MISERKKVFKLVSETDTEQIRIHSGLNFDELSQRSVVEIERVCNKQGGSSRGFSLHEKYEISLRCFVWR